MVCKGKTSRSFFGCEVIERPGGGLGRLSQIQGAAASQREPGKHSSLGERIRLKAKPATGTEHKRERGERKSGELPPGSSMEEFKIKIYDGTGQGASMVIGLWGAQQAAAAWE